MRTGCGVLQTNSCTLWSTCTRPFDACRLFPSRYQRDWDDEPLPIAPAGGYGFSIPVCAELGADQNYGLTAIVVDTRRPVGSLLLGTLLTVATKGTCGLGATLSGILTFNCQTPIRVGAMPL